MLITRVLTLLLIFIISTYSYAGFLDIFTRKDTSCEYMLKNTPKKSIQENFLKYVIGGAAAGGTAGTILDKNDRARGTLIGVIGGVAVGYIYGGEKLDKFKAELRENLIKQGIKPPYIEIAELRTMEMSSFSLKKFLSDPIKFLSEFFSDSFKDKTVFKKDDYIYIFLRIKSLKENPEEAVNITYKYKLYRDGNFITSFYDVINLPQGEVSDLFAIPVCNQTLPGKYELEVEVENEFAKSKRKVSWVVEN